MDLSPLDERGLPRGASDVFVPAQGDLAESGESLVHAEFAFGQAQALIRRAFDALDADVPSPVEIDRVDEAQTRTGSHVRFEHRVRGQRLFGSSFAVHAVDGADYAVTGLLVGNPEAADPGPYRRWPQEDVAASCREQLGLGPDHRLEIELVALPDRRWAHEVKVPVHGDGRFADLRVYLHNETLKVIWQFDVAARAGIAGLAFRCNPARDQLGPVTFAEVGPPTDYLLSTSGIDVEPAQTGRLVRGKADFQLQSTDVGFDEVQAFFHLQEGLAFYGTLIPAGAMTKPWLNPVRALVNDPDSADNAFFSPTTGQILLGDFDYSRPSARSGDIVVHELGHAVSHAVIGWGEASGQQTKALSEGFADYFAAAHFGDPRIGDYVMANNAALFRDLDKAPLHLPPTLDGEEHAMGEIFGGLLWQLRSADAAYVDDMAAEALQLLHRTSTILEGINALRLVDRRLDPMGSRGISGLIDAEWNARKP